MTLVESCVMLRNSLGVIPCCFFGGVGGVFLWWFAFWFLVYRSLIRCFDLLNVFWRKAYLCYGYSELPFGAVVALSPFPYL